MILHSPTPPPEPRYLTVAEVADRIGKSEDYVRNLCRYDKQLGATKDENGHWQIPVEAIDYILTGQLPPTPQQPALDAPTRWQQFTSQPWIFWPVTAFAIFTAIWGVFGVAISSGADFGGFQSQLQEWGWIGSGCTRATDEETLILLTTFHSTAAINSEPHKKILRQIQAELDRQELNKVKPELVDVVLNSDERSEAEELGKECNASILIWGEDTGVEIITNFLNIRQPDFDAAEAKIVESGDKGKTQVANPGAYAQFVTKDLPSQMSFLSLFAIGQSYFVDEKYEQAAQVIEQSISALNGITTAIGLADAHFLLGWIYQVPLQQIIVADAQYSVTIELDPKYAKAYTNRGNARYTQNDLGGALADYDKAIELDPKNVLSYNNRGTIRYEQNDLRRAFADYDKAIELDPKNAVAYYNRGTVRYKQNDLGGSLADFDKAIELDLKIAVAYNDRGAVRYEQSDLSGALRDYNKAIELDPEYVAAYNNRGAVRYEQSDLSGAIADYDKAIELDPKNAVAYNNRGKARVAQNDLGGAIADYDKAIELDPSYVGAYNNRGNARIDQNDLSGAIADYDKAIELDPNYAIAYNNRGNARKDRHDLSGAIAGYDKAIELDPNYAIAYNNRGNARKDQRDLSGAIADYNKAIELDPKFANSYAARGLTKTQLGELEEAKADFQRFLELVPSDHPLRSQVEQWSAEIEAELAQEK